MKQQINKRRRFIKTSLAIPLFTHLNNNSVRAHEVSGSSFLVPGVIYDELVALYGNDANFIGSTNRLFLKVPPIAENGAVVSVNVSGDESLVSSVTIFVERNKIPLAAHYTLHEGSGLPVALRVKVSRTSDVYMIARTANGLVGIKEQVKVTIGCGGV